MSIRIKDFQSLIPKEFSSLFNAQGAVDALELAFAREADINRDQREVPFVATDETLDWHGERIATGAFHETRAVFLRNPVLLAQHQHRLNTGTSPVIGSVRELGTDRNPVDAIARFAEPPSDKDHWSLYRDGHQRAFSIGFFVHDTEKRDNQPLITKGTLIEISAVPVPANPNALVRCFVEGRLAGRAAQSADRGEIAELRAAIDEIAGHFRGAFGDPARRNTEGESDEEVLKAFAEAEAAWNA